MGLIDLTGRLGLATGFPASAASRCATEQTLVADGRLLIRESF